MLTFLFLFLSKESMSQTKALLEQELVSRKEEHDREILELKVRDAVYILSIV